MDRRERRAVDEHGPDSVEQDLECAKEGLAKQGVEEERFHGRGKIGIESRDPERFVMREMVRLGSNQPLFPPNETVCGAPSPQTDLRLTLKAAL